MLRKQRRQVLNMTIAVEYFSLAILHIFLNIQRNRLGKTEILHIIGNSHTQIFTQCKEVINSMTRQEHDCSVSGNRNFLLSEFFRGQSLYLNK